MSYLDDVCSAYPYYARHSDPHYCFDCCLSMSCASSFQPPHEEFSHKLLPSLEGGCKMIPMWRTIDTCEEREKVEGRQVKYD